MIHRVYPTPFHLSKIYICFSQFLIVYMVIKNRKTPTERMEELKEYYQLYSSQWEEWIKHKKDDQYLTQEELYALSIYKRNNFKISFDDQIMFYYKTEQIMRVSEKLKRSKKEFKAWAVDQWQLSLIQIGLETDLVFFFKTDIDQLNLNEDLKNILKRFNRNTIKEILESYSEKDFTTDFFFRSIQYFIAVYKKQELICINM
jgi:hypothetical protein